MKRAQVSVAVWLLVLPLARPVRGQAPAQEAPAADTRAVLQLTLEDALSIALQADLGLAIEDTVVDASRHRYAGSWGAFDPVFTATGSISDSEFKASTTTQSGGGTPIVIEERNTDFGAGLDFPLTTGGTFALNFDSNANRSNSAAQISDESSTDVFALSYTQPLLRGAWRSYATSRQRQGELAWNEAREHHRQVRQELLLAVQNSYWDLVAALEQLKVADVTLGLGREQLDQNQRRLDAGVGTEVDVRAAADLLKASLFANDYKRWDVEIEPVTPLPLEFAITVVPWQAALSVALEQRPEVRQQRLAIERADIELVRARSEREPQLDLTLATFARGFDAKSDEAFESASTWEFPSNQASVTFSVPIFNRAGKNAERAARADLIRARLEADRVELTITAEVRDAVRQVEYQAEAVRAAQKSLELARRQLEAEEARYREGLSTTFQVLQFQQQLAEALSSEKRARADAVKAAAALAKAQGLTEAPPRAK
jgi:outer membrane protein